MYQNYKEYHCRDDSYFSIRMPSMLKKNAVSVFTKIRGFRFLIKPSVKILQNFVIVSWKVKENIFIFCNKYIIMKLWQYVWKYVNYSVIKYWLSSIFFPTFLAAQTSARDCLVIDAAAYICFRYVTSWRLQRQACWPTIQHISTNPKYDERRSSSHGRYFRRSSYWWHLSVGS